MLRLLDYRRLVPRYHVVGEIAEQLRFGVQCNLYRYLVGLWKKICMELRRRSGMNALELARHVKVVLCLGGNTPASKV